jgi:PAS domain S-box-containing protein
MSERTVRVPEEIEPIFARAEQVVAEYFGSLRQTPAEGTIEVLGERYVLVRAAALSVEFFTMVRSMFGLGRRAEADEFARNLLFDVSHAVGKSDARQFQDRMGLTDPIERLSAGPVHFAHTGWATVDISPESRPSPDDDYFLLYDHPYSFEADSWLRADRKADFPVCIMSAGYSSGWCEESFDMELVASEILCRAKGDSCCRFIMAPPGRIEEHIGRYVEARPELAVHMHAVKVPDFLVRKRMEEQLSAREQQHRGIFDCSADAILIFSPDRFIVDVNPAACTMYGYDRDEMIGLSADDIIPQEYYHEFRNFERELSRRGQYSAESVNLRKDGSRLHIELRGTPYNYAGRRHLLVLVRDVSERRKAQEELRQSEKRFRMLADSLPQTVFEMDLQGQLTFVNQGGLSMFGYSREDLAGGLNAFNMFGQAEQQRVRRNVERIVSGDLSGEGIEYSAVRKDGGEITVTVHAAPITVGGRAEGLRGIVVDVTEARRVQADLRIRNRVVESSVNPIVTTDLEGRLTFVNGSFLTLWDYRAPRDVLGKEIGEFWHMTEANSEQLRGHGSWIGTVSGHRRDGSPVVLQLCATLVRDEGGHPLCMAFSFVDNTELNQLKRRLRAVHSFAGIVGETPEMLDLFDTIREVAEVDVPVLIQGESGTGKELVAAAIHNEGPRAGKPFVIVNCGAVPEGILESELFGHVRGAFTGAIRDRKGRFELADQGTIFLDEVGDIPPTMQVKLLRVLQEGTFERAGGEGTVHVDVRILSATNKDLRKEIAAKRFREDLFYRLAVVPVTLPPLRQRRNDIPVLAEHLLKQRLAKTGRPQVSFAQDTLDAIMDYPWPGNVRELENAIQYALVKCGSEPLEARHLPPTVLIPEGQAGPTLRKRRRRKLSASAVRQALADTGGNRLRAAKRLGVSRATLYRFLDDVDLAEDPAAS